MNNLKYSVIIPTNRNIKKTIPLLISLQNQRIQADEVFFIIDKKISKNEYTDYIFFLKSQLDKVFLKKIILITNINSKFTPWKWVWFNRNYWFSLVNNEITLGIDDDNILDNNFSEKLMNVYSSYYEKYKKYPILIPMQTVNWKLNTKSIWKSFCYSCWKPNYLKYDLNKKKYKFNFIFNSKKKYIWWEILFPIEFASSNCFRGPSSVFKKYPFDEDFEFVYEDFDFTRRIFNQKIPIFAVLTVKEKHNMKKKNRLEKLYISSKELILKKSRNRIRFAKNNFTIDQKIFYFWLWLRIHTAYLLVMIFMFADKKNKKMLIKNLFKWIKLWFK